MTKNTGGGDVVEITGRTGGTVTFSGAISASGGAGGIDIDANTGGTINFTGQTTLSTGAINAVDITGNAGATINFNAGGNGLDITTTTGVGFNATGPGPLATTGGTVNVQGSGNTISSTSGTALNVVHTTIGASNLTFQSISSNGAASGIILNNTGSSGGLHVTGDGGAGSGGTIANKTGTDGSNTQGVGIYLNNTADVQLNHMLLNRFGNFAIKASDLNGLGGVATNNAFSLQNSVINGNNGNNSGLDEGAIFISNSSGVHTINASQISGGLDDDLRILYDSATADTATFNITGNTFSALQSTATANGPHQPVHDDSGIGRVERHLQHRQREQPGAGQHLRQQLPPESEPAAGDAYFGDGILATFEAPFQHTVNIDNNTFTKLFQAMDMATNFSADVNYRIANGFYSFEGLATGSYIVQINEANFNSGAALDGLISVIATSADPDDNVDNDDNGVRVTGQGVVSAAIDLDYDLSRPPAPATTPTTRSIFGFLKQRAAGAHQSRRRYCDLHRGRRVCAARRFKRARTRRHRHRHEQHRFQRWQPDRLHLRQRGGGRGRARHLYGGRKCHAIGRNQYR